MILLQSVALFILFADVTHSFQAPRVSRKISSLTAPSSPLLNNQKSTSKLNSVNPWRRSHSKGAQQLRVSTSSLSSDPVMREFEVKEAAITKQREKAAALLAEYDQSLQKIQGKKLEYIAAAQLPDSPLGGSFSETTVRSIVKSFCWRIIAGAVTFVTTLKFSGSVTQALQVVGADFFSKSFTMFLGERLMNKSKLGRQKGADNATRSLMKALIWRLFAVSNTLCMAIFIAKDLSIASKIASTDAVIKTTLMYLYERVWAKISWGKEYLIEFSI